VGSAASRSSSPERLRTGALNTALNTPATASATALGAASGASAIAGMAITPPRLPLAPPPLTTSATKGAASLGARGGVGGVGGGGGGGGAIARSLSARLQAQLQRDFGEKLPEDWREILKEVEALKPLNQALFRYWLKEIFCNTQRLSLRDA
jgi:hypothetical protein